MQGCNYVSQNLGKQLLTKILTSPPFNYEKDNIHINPARIPTIYSGPVGSTAELETPFEDAALNLKTMGWTKRVLKGQLGTNAICLTRSNGSWPITLRRGPFTTMTVSQDSVVPVDELMAQMDSFLNGAATLVPARTNGLAKALVEAFPTAGVDLPGLFVALCNAYASMEGSVQKTYVSRGPVVSAVFYVNGIRVGMSCNVKYDKSITLGFGPTPKLRTQK